MTKTTEQLQALKENWKKDPCWDIYETEGFEDYREELLAFQVDHENELSMRRLARDLKEADRLGLDLNQYNEYEKLSYQEERRKDCSKRLLKHYIGLDRSLDSDMRSELEEIVDSIVEASIAAVKKDIILSNGRS